MSLKDELETAAHAIVAPQDLPVLLAKIAIGLMVALIAGWIIWKLFFAEHQAEAKHDLAAAHGQAVVNQAQGNAGAAAVGVVAGAAAAETRIHEVTRDHYYEITKQPGASDPVSQPVWDAFERSVCMRVSAASLPECHGLQEANP